MLILIDGNAMGHVHHNGTTLTCGTMQTQAVYGFTRMLRDMRHSHPNARMMVLWDGRAQFRYDLYPEYKGNRDVKDDPKKQAHRDAYRAQTPYIKGMTKALGIAQVRSPELEADDLAGFFVSRERERESILLVTGDRDWLQLVDEQVAWLDPRGGGKRIDLTNFLDMTGYHSPVEFLQGKALMGDSSDTITGVGGIGEKGAPLFLAEHRTVWDFFAKVDEGKFVPKKKPHQKLASPEGRAIFERNMALMDLMTPRKPDPTTLEVDKGPVRLDYAKRLCEKLGFLSILNQWDEWSRPFGTTEEMKEAA